MAFEPAEARVAVTEAVQPRIEIVMQLPDDTPAASDAHPRPMLVDAFRTNEPGDGNAVAAYLSLWAGSLLLKDVLKDEPVADDKRKLKVHNGNCDCC